MRVCSNQKGKEKAKEGPVFASRTFYSRTYLSFFPQISSGKQLQRMYSKRCVIRSCTLAVSEKQGYLLNSGAIYHGKYVHPRPVKG